MKHTNGFSLIELLIAMGVFGIILTVVGAFFAFQTRTTTRVQGTNEMNVRLRSVGELVSKDLQLTGGQAVVVGGTPAYINQVRSICDPPDSSGEPDGTNADCIVVDEISGDVSLVYASSLWPAGERCRRIVYHLDSETTLHRADVTCGSGTPTGWGFGTELASGIDGFQTSFTCELVDTNSDGTPDSRIIVADPKECYAQGSYIRSGTVSVSGTSSRPFGLANNLSLTTNMPNVRNPIDFSGAP